jgi:single-stranded DNA-binding protein
MNRIIITDAIISKGYKDAPAFRFNEKKTAVQFKIGQRVYDKDAPDKHRYINFAVKAFGALSERIEKMQLKESSRVNICGRLDEENWEENGQKFSRFVIIAEKVEYASDGNKTNGNGTNNNGGNSVPQNQNGSGNGQTAAPPAQSQQNSSNENMETPANFTGFDNFGGGNDNVFF